MVHAYWEAKVDGSPEEFETSLTNMVKPHPLKKKKKESLPLLKMQKISWAWWHVPVVPATREAEAGESLEPGRRRLR